MTKKNQFTIKPFGNTPSVKISIDYAEYRQYRYLVDKVKPNEVQWYSFVEREINNNKFTYHVSGMMIPAQEVTSVEADTNIDGDPMKIFRLYNELKDQYQDDSELGYDEELVNSKIQQMHVWCHSHPFTDNPTPSGTDDDQFATWVNENQIAQGVESPMVALIFGTSDKIHARVYDPMLSGIYFDNVSVDIAHNIQIDTTYMDEAIENKITVKKPVIKGFSNWLPNHASSRGRSAFNSRTSQPSYRPNITPPTTSLTSVVELEPEDSDEKWSTPSAVYSTFFASKYPFVWTKLMRDINTNYHNEEEVKELLEFLTDHWLRNDVAIGAFMAAMLSTNPNKDLDKEIPPMNSDEALVILVDYLKTIALDSDELEDVVKFAMAYEAAESSEDKQKALSDYTNTFFDMDLWS